jgi:hypothetical protein
MADDEHKAPHSEHAHGHDDYGAHGHDTHGHDDHRHGAAAGDIIPADSPQDMFLTALAGATLIGLIVMMFWFYQEGGKPPSQYGAEHGSAPVEHGSASPDRGAIPTEQGTVQPDQAVAPTEQTTVQPEQGASPAAAGEHH